MASKKNQTEENIEMTEACASGESLKAEIARLEAEVLELRKAVKASEDAQAETNDKYLRVVAEYDNFRKRSAKEREAIYSGAYADVVKQLLPVVDNLERASAYGEAEKVAEGVKMICRSFSDVLVSLGITEIEAEGKEFDPNVHNAVFHVEDEAYGENVIVEVLQKGYKLGDNVIRYAMVKVAN